MIAAATLGDVVQQNREIEDRPRQDLVDDIGRQRMVFLEGTRFDARQDPDGADRVLVDRIGVIHVVLRLRDDATEIGNEAAEHTGFVEAPQRRFRVVRRRQHLHEETIGLGIAAQPVDQSDVLGDQPQGRGMDIEAVLLRDMEEAEDRHGILGEGVRTRDRQPLAIETETFELARAQGLPKGGELRLAPAAVFEGGDEDAREVADRLGVKIIVLGKALDAAAARTVLVAEARGDLALQVEGQAVVGAAGEIMDMATDGGEEAFGAFEVAGFAARQDALGHQLAWFADAIEILGDPEQQMEIAQPALALLDVGFDDVARIAHAMVALVAFGKLGLDEVVTIADIELLREAARQLVEQLAVAPEVARFQEGRPDRLVALGVAQALLDGACGMTDLQAEIPQQVEHEFDDLLAAWRLLVGAQEQEVDVRQGRQLAAAVAAGGDDAQPFGGAGVGRRIGVLVGEVEQDPDDLVHQVGGRDQDGGAVIAQRALLFLEPAADFAAARGQGIAQQGENGRPWRLAARRHVLDQGRQGFFQGAAAHDASTVGDLVIGLGHVVRSYRGDRAPCQHPCQRPSQLGQISCHKGQP